MKLYALLMLISSLLLLMTSCNKDEDPSGPRTYFHDPNFVKDGLVAYYPMNGDVNDYSGNNNHGIIIHSPTPSIDRFGISNGAYLFDGIDDFIEISNSASLSRNAGTICFWVRVPFNQNESEVYRAILAKADASQGFVVSARGGMSPYDLSIRYENEVKRITNISGNFWESSFESIYTFVAFTFTENSLAYYANGYSEVNTSASQSLFNNNDNNLYIGKGSLGKVEDYFFPSYKNFKGEIDDVLIYDRELTNDEILQLSKWRKE